jgi:hypothetical protein
MKEGPLGFGNQVLISSHRKPLWSKAVLVSLADRDKISAGMERKRTAAAVQRGGFVHRSRIGCHWVLWVMSVDFDPSELRPLYPQ